MIPVFNSIVLDVIVVVLLLTIVAIGAFKGVLHTSINFGLFVGSLLLGFTSVTDFIKIQIVKLIDKWIVLGAGVGNEVKLGIYFLYNAIASLVLTIIFYIILRLIKYLILMSIKGKKSTRRIYKVTAVSRLGGAAFSLLFSGLLFVFCLSLFNTSFIGGKKVIENSYVTKYIVVVDDPVLDLLKKPDIEDIVIFQLVKGDLFAKVTTDDISHIQKLAKIVGEKKEDVSNVEDVELAVDSLYHLLSFVSQHALNEDGSVVEVYGKAVELTKNVSTDIVNQINAVWDAEEKLEAKNTLAVSNLLKEVVSLEIAGKFEQIFVLASEN